MIKNKDFKNGKYYIGPYKKGFEKRKGWFLGSFFEEENPLKNEQIEICHTTHEKGEIIKPHYHEKKVEVLIIIKGRACYTVNGKKFILRSGDFLFADVNNVIEGEFLVPTEIFAIHSPSLPKDKITL